MSAVKEKAPTRQRQGFGVNHLESIHMTDITALQAGAQQLVRVFAGQIGGVPAQVCDGRELHAFLKNGKQFSDWIKHRISQYGFEENMDFAIASPKSEAKRGGHNRVDYHLTLDMAKELSMVENNEQGRMARRYFIECEKRANASGVQPVQLPAAEAYRQVAFEGRRIRVLMRDGRPWFAAAQVASALGLRSSDRITRSALSHELCRTMRGKQSINYLSPRLALRAADYARHELGERWREWLQRTLVELTPSPPGIASVTAPGFNAVERFGLEQLMNTRLLLGFNVEGGIEVKAVKPEAMVVTPERLASVIGDGFVVGEQYLPEILSAVAGRMRRVA